MQLVRIACNAPSHGWLPVSLATDEKCIKIDASDVPNNPVQDLIAALEMAARGTESIVWWNLEPHGYFMYLTPSSGEVHLRIDYAAHSERSLGANVLAVSGSPKQVLLPFWRFLREFQSHGYVEPHWPPVDYSRMGTIKDLMEGRHEV